MRGGRYRINGGDTLIVCAFDEKEDLVLLEFYLVVGLGRIVVRGSEDGQVALGVRCGHAWVWRRRKAREACDLGLITN
jgi:hypothetical protein